jgi:hypothetical protein
MYVRLLAAGTLLWCAALVQAQSEPAKAATDSNTQARQEAERQGRAALKPNAEGSPSQSMRQAIAFERYKEQAAELQEQKEAAGTTPSSGSRAGSKPNAPEKRKQ